MENALHSNYLFSCTWVRSQNFCKLVLESKLIKRIVIFRCKSFERLKKRNNSLYYEEKVKYYEENVKSVCN